MPQGTLVSSQWWRALVQGQEGWERQVEEIREDFLEEEDLHGLILGLRSAGSNLVSHPSPAPPPLTSCVIWVVI